MFIAGSRFRPEGPVLLPDGDVADAGEEEAAEDQIEGEHGQGDEQRAGGEQTRLAGHTVGVSKVCAPELAFTN